MRAASPPRSGAPREAPAVELPEDADRPLFATLRAWRNEQARKDGVPPYVLFTNAELARIVRARPASLNALGALQGIGPGKVARYGAAILAELHGPPAASAGTAESTPDVPAGEAAS
jgi:ATP-dependent DNA helicase RecQ